jgi:hypothetical protein
MKIQDLVFNLIEKHTKAWSDLPFPIREKMVQHPYLFDLGERPNSIATPYLFDLGERPNSIATPLIVYNGVWLAHVTNNWTVEHIDFPPDTPPVTVNGPPTGPAGANESISLPGVSPDQLFKPTSKDSRGEF